MSVASAQRFQHILRHLRLLSVADNFRYLTTVVRLSRNNREFIAANPGFDLPPKALAYDAYSAPDWTFYKQSGAETAAFLAGIIRQRLGGKEGLKILEWGCGPARVIRHLPAAVGGAGTEVYGSDYNPASIAWCRQHIPHINFVSNGLEPPLPLGAGQFDFIYAISVFTHLSEAVSQQWVAELSRVARPGGMLVVTTNGDSMQRVMLPAEQQAYRASGVVIRGYFKEGKRCFSTIYSPVFARNELFKGLEVVQHAPAGFPHTGQDYWVLRKPVPT
jgi:SAM-dependent methyltransferase